MHLHFEESCSSQLRCDSVINSLSWMGRVPDEQPEGHGWKLNRTSYYQEGWLAAGNAKSVVGVTFTSTLAEQQHQQLFNQLPVPPRTNYNLRGHRAQINLVRWNEPYQKLATCDASGIIFVWIRYEGRWSIELINDRNTPVTHFAWSHDGRMAVIAYQDGFVLVGSVAGQRYWSTVLTQESTITTGTWTPDDQQVYLGTSNGTIVVLDVHNGAVVAQIQMSECTSPGASLLPPPTATPVNNSIRQLAWNCPRFKMEEPTTTSNDQQHPNAAAGHSIPSSGGRGVIGGGDDHVLAVLTGAGRLSFIKSFDDVQTSVTCPPVDGQQHSDRLLTSPVMEWNNDGELLCLAGHYVNTTKAGYTNVLQFYNSRGVLRFRIQVPYTHAPITCLTWGHNDRRLFVATGCTIHVGWVTTHRIASLQHLARLRLRRFLNRPEQLENILSGSDRFLPRLIKDLVTPLFTSTVHCHVPDEQRMRDYICRPPPGNTRLYCTMIRRGGGSDAAAGEDTTNGPDGIDPNDPAASATASSSSSSAAESGVAFTLYLEFLGGLIPLLKGKPTSRLRPEFIIFDPLPNQDKKILNPTSAEPLQPCPIPTPTPTPVARRFHQLLSPALQRRRRRKASTGVEPSDSEETDNESCVSTPRLQRKLLHVAPSPPLSAVQNKQSHKQQQQHTPLVQVTSNIWGTKFRISGLSPTLPSYLGQVTYRTSLLHLQPRQMTLGVVDLRDSSNGSSPASSDSSATKEANQYQLSNPGSDDDEHHQTNTDDRTCNEVAVAPMTPNLRMQRRREAAAAASPAANARRLQPPPSPTHQLHQLSSRSGGSAMIQRQLMADDVIRFELNSQQETERIVLASPSILVPLPLRRWRSLSTGQLTVKVSPGRRRKSRSLDSSPVQQVNNRCRLPGVRRSWAVQFRQATTTEKRIVSNNSSSSFRSRIGSQVQQSLTSAIVEPPQPSPPINNIGGGGGGVGGARDKRFTLARLSPLFGRKLLRSNNDARNKAGRLSEPNTPLPSPALTRRTNNNNLNQPITNQHERRPSPIRQLLNSPLLSRRLGRGRFSSSATTSNNEIESSDDDLTAATAHNYQDLESFQKAQMLNKIRQTLIAEKNGESSSSDGAATRSEFILNNKAPLWNEHSQVYQLDFGGRVTQESAKNFQIEFKGKQVMQFGRIDGNAYTLDFQYPFSAVQAFAVALANVTQRLK